MAYSFEHLPFLTIVLQGLNHLKSTDGYRCRSVLRNVRTLSSSQQLQNINSSLFGKLMMYLLSICAYI